MAVAAHHPPLVVDLDGTLINTDLLVETGSAFVTARPLQAPFAILGWLLQGKAVLKGRLAENTRLEVATLPYNQELLAWLRTEKARGRRLVLATASHRTLAERVASHLQVFDEVFATEGRLNLKAAAKRDLLVARFGAQGFEYIGNDGSDAPVWQAAAQAHLVCHAPGVAPALPACDLAPGRVFATGRGAWPWALLRAMRPHQWLKNLLVFLPLLTAHLYTSASNLFQAAAAFLAFGLAASSVYLLNDLADVAADRHHEHKRLRPLASGDLDLLHGWLAWPLLLLAAFGLSAAVLPPQFGLVLLTYVTVSTAYALRLKQVPVLDVLILAGLYALRLIAGAAAIAIAPSFWLLAFAMFFFLSLAFMKRYSELRRAGDADPAAMLRRRGYSPQDMELVATLGSGAGQVAVLVLALYIHDSQTASLYAEPRWIWLACPLMLYWTSRAWMLASRGAMHEDPVLFAVRDRVSWMVVGLIGAAFLLARVAA